MTIKVLAAPELQTLNLEIKAAPEMMTTIVNLLGAIQWCGQVGHSAVVGAFIDGDGADFVEFKGLPKNDGPEQAAACSDRGDGVLAKIGPYTATAFSSTYKDIGGETFQVLHSKKVWPKDHSDR